MRRSIILATLTACLSSVCREASAHASEGGHVLLLPTGYYLAGGAAAVAASFLVVAILPASWLDAALRRRLVVMHMRERPRTTVSLIAFLLLATLVAAGLAGSRDPLSNPLPLFVWTMLWVCLTLVCGLFGNVWTWINPWYGPWRIARRLVPGLSPLRLPAWLGQWPAVATLAAFAWFELVDPAPDDPSRLAAIVASYWLFTFAGICLFGYRPWIRRVEFLSHFLAAISHLSLAGARSKGGKPRLFLCLPGAKAAEAAPRHVAGVVFLLFSLASVSFDGFMRTFAWLGWIGVNPLDFPGRSALILPHTLGLLAMAVLLAAAFFAAVLLGHRMAGARGGLGQAAGLLIWSIVPISLAYHFAHYLTSSLVNIQYFWVSLSDPFGLGWNLLGGTGRHVHAGIVLGHQAAWLIWNLQAIAIVAGHVLAVAVAHVIAWRLHGSSARATLSQLPLAILMVAYTLFGLWLLSTPSAG